jgi:hypothetical protein
MQKIINCLSDIDILLRCLEISIAPTGEMPGGTGTMTVCITAEHRMESVGGLQRANESMMIGNKVVAASRTAAVHF